MNRCRQLGARPLVINFDEGRPELDRRAWWSAYLAGGVWEAHVLDPYDQPFSAWETTWTELGGARTFMESVSFQEMEPHNELVTVGQAFCLARPPESYVLYLPAGGAVTVILESDRSYVYDWWNPANGASGVFQDRGEIAGGLQEFSVPANGDWALRIVAHP